MPAVVLESSIGSQYEDNPSSYEFPSRYLKFFEGAGRSEPLYAVLYEPRGEGNSGRMKYVGWAQIAGPPVPSGRSAKGGTSLFRVYYTAPAESFEQAVPRELVGEPLESWLRSIPRGRQRNVATLGRAVRPLSEADFQRILELGGAATVGQAAYPAREHLVAAGVAARERTEMLVSVLKRGAEFRRDVIGAYEERCAVSGFGLGRVPVSKAAGLLDAAHIRPVSLEGSDEVSNGLPLTPTLHRFFDAGLFSLEYREDVPQVLVSPRLDRTMISSPDGSFQLNLIDGIRLRLPRDPRARPNPEQVLFHRRRVFIAEP